MKEMVAQKAKQIDDIIEKYLPKEAGEQITILEAMNYSIHVGGKRLRPMLMQASYQMFGGTGEAIEPFMAAIEMIHTYSLVHDDLPAMDNDEYRRGQLSTHAKYGHAMGVLAGDGLLNYAFETALKAYDIEPSDKIIAALKILANKAGVYGMVGGQVVDVQSDGKKIPMETIKYIHENKTAAMIESALMIGATLAGAPKDEIDIIEKVGSDVGLAFQIQDDILDVTSTLEVLGKPIGSDAKNDKSTYVSLVGLDKAREDVREVSERAIGNLNELSVHSDFLEGLIRMLITRES